MAADNVLNDGTATTMRLKYQIFLILLLISGLLIALMASIGSWSFNRGFIGYINDTERQQLEPMIEELAAGYAREGDWQWITDDQSAWKALFDSHFSRGRGRPIPDENRERPDRHDGPRSDANAQHRPPESGAAPPPPPRGKASPTLTMDPRLLLADSTQQVLIGRERDDRKIHWQPVTVENLVVGYLGYRERVTLPGQLDKAFAAQQRRGFLYAALAMVLLSALLAVALAGRLVRPLLVVNDAVARISSGQYAYRVPEQRGDEIGDLSRSINTLATTLEKNLDARRQWLAEISHELRTPVAVLQGELEAIQDGVNRLDEAAISSLHTETLRLARLIDDLHHLTLSDVGALDYRFERLDLGKVVAERVESARMNPEAAALSITVKQSPAILTVNGDAQRLGQLADNLLQNSFRYTNTGGVLRVTLSHAPGRAILNWADSAPGVDETQLTRLFEPLYRVEDSRNRSNGGAGLGLAIVKRIVEAHGGTITASKSSLGGLAFRVELPLSQQNSA